MKRREKECESGSRATSGLAARPASQPAVQLAAWLAAHFALVQLRVKALGTHGLLSTTWVLPVTHGSNRSATSPKRVRCILQASFPVFEVVYWKNLNFG